MSINDFLILQQKIPIRKGLMQWKLKKKGLFPMSFIFLLYLFPIYRCYTIPVTISFCVIHFPLSWIACTQNLKKLQSNSIYMEVHVGMFWFWPPGVYLFQCKIVKQNLTVTLHDSAINRLGSNPFSSTFEIFSTISIYCFFYSVCHISLIFAMSVR